jgi:hypothetical protein
MSREGRWSCFHIEPVGPWRADNHPRNRIQVIGPGGRVELDFLTSPAIADRIASAKNLALAAFEERMDPGKMVMPFDVYVREQRKASEGLPPRCVGV